MGVDEFKFLFDTAQGKPKTVIPETKTVNTEFETKTVIPETNPATFETKSVTTEVKQEVTPEEKTRAEIQGFYQDAVTARNKAKAIEYKKGRKEEKGLEDKLDRM